MAQVNAKGRTKLETYFRALHHIMDSPAYLSLSPVARSIWLEVGRRYNGFNNGSIPFSCREAAIRLGVGKNTAATAFGELIDKGFLIVMADSSFNMKETRSRRWAMTHLKIDKKLATNDWRKWKDKN